MKHIAAIWCRRSYRIAQDVVAGSPKKPFTPTDNFRTPEVAPLFGIPEENGLSYAQDKLKHVPQCAARKLSAVSFQHSAFESPLSQNGMSELRHEIVAARKETGG
jgi:hypothetical protein